MAPFPNSEGKTSTSTLIDATGLFCPLPIVKLKKALAELAPGERVVIWADDPAFGDDLISWCQETKNKLLSLSKQKQNFFIAVVEKSDEN